MRAADANGTTWGQPTTLDGFSIGPAFISLTTISGNPAVGYYDGVHAFLKYRRATDADGTTWGPVMTLDFVDDVGQYPSLAEVNGNAAVSYYDNTNHDLKWATFAAPEIAVEQPAGTPLLSGSANVAFVAPIGASGTASRFTIRVASPGVLTVGSINIDGANPADFSVNTNGMNNNLANGSSTTFTVTFNPATGPATGTRTAVLHISNNSASANPFDVTLTGTALSPNTDTDGDGLNDALEYQLASAGFDWQASQPAKVSAFLSNNALYNQTQYTSNRTAGQNDVLNSPNTFSLYTLSQVEKINVDAPLLVRDAGTGQFKLTMSLKKTGSLNQPFVDFPMSAPQTVINAQGKLEFTFTVPDNAAFFRLQAQ